MHSNTIAKCHCQYETCYLNQHSTFVSIDFSQSSDCTVDGTSFIINVFSILQRVKLLQGQDVSKSVTLTSVMFSRSATMPVMNMSSNLRYICCKAVAYNSCTTERVIKYADPEVKWGNSGGK